MFVTLISNLAQFTGMTHSDPTLTPLTDSCCLYVSLCLNTWQGGALPPENLSHGQSRAVHPIPQSRAVNPLLHSRAVHPLPSPRMDRAALNLLCMQNLVTGLSALLGCSVTVRFQPKVYSLTFPQSLCLASMLYLTQLFLASFPFVWDVSLAISSVTPTDQVPQSLARVYPMFYVAFFCGCHVLYTTMASWELCLT